MRGSEKSDGHEGMCLKPLLFCIFSKNKKQSLRCSPIKVLGKKYVLLLLAIVARSRELQRANH